MVPVNLLVGGMQIRPEAKKHKWSDLMTFSITARKHYSTFVYSRYIK